MRLPFNGRNRMTSPYGTRVLNGAAGWHAGIDLVGDDNKTVHSVCAGTVYSSTMVAKSSGDLTWQWGNYVCIKGDDGRYYYYCHLASRAVAKGARVQEGDVLGVMGNTGYSFGAHTHFEVRKSDRRTTLNAATVLGVKNVCGTYTQDKPAETGANTFMGIDVSKHQGTIDWQAVKASGVQFAVVRAGWSWYDGGLTIDDYFARNMQQATAAGLDVGVYVYAYDLTPEAARIAAQRTLEAVAPYKLTYPIYYDQEYEERIKALDKQTRTDNCKAFLSAVEAAGYYSGLYASKDWLDNWVYPDQLAQYDKWVAQYADACTYSGAYGMWQYKGSTGTCPGVTGACDRNIAYKDYPTIIAQAGLNHLTDTAPTPDTAPDKPAALDPAKPMRLTVTAANCEIFGAMDVAAPLGKLPKDTVYDVTEYYPAEVLLGSLRGNWVKIKMANGEIYYCLALNDRTELANVWQPAAGETVKTTAVLNVRSAPATSYMIVGKLAESTTATLAEVADGWGYVKDKGWVCLEYVSAAI